MSQRELSAKAGVSTALLSQLENGVTDPSLATLRKLATVFQAEVSSLFTEPNAPLIHLSRPGERMHLTAPRGQVSYERLTPGRGELEVLRAVMQPGDVSSAQPRCHESTECAVVLEGSVVAEVDDQRYVLAAGESLTFHSRLAHRYCNESAERAVFLLAVSPPTP